MEHTLELLYSLREVVLNPTWGSALAILSFSAVNEILALFPFAVVISGQLVFLEVLDGSLFLKLLLMVALPVGVGSAIGTLPLYFLTYFGGRPAINKFEEYLHFSWADVEKINTRFKGQWYDEIIFLFMRSVPILPSLPVTIVAGVLRFRFPTYLLLSMAGFTLRMIITMLVVGLGIENLSKFLVFLYTI